MLIRLSVGLHINLCLLQCIHGPRCFSEVVTAVAYGVQEPVFFFLADQASAVASGGWPRWGIFGGNCSHLLQK
jgi:hypothetical protein